MDFINELHWRGLIAEKTPDVEKLFNSEKVTAYIGFDPTSKSLHVGSLLPIMALVRLQRCGHNPIVVMGGGTGLIGDPSGKTNERSILSNQEITENLQSIDAQLSNFLDFSNKVPNPAKIINNAEWLSQLNLIDFMRDTGKHFTVNYMLRLESIRSRISRDTGISFTEFSYMTLQAFDYLNLFEKHGCKLQMGGSDQWGNILAGVDLINKKNPGTTSPLAHGIVFPLITSSSGEKFGKSLGDAPTLDPSETSPYKLYQFFLNTTDQDVINYLKYFTLLSEREISDLNESLENDAKKRIPQKKLAEEVVNQVHGEKGIKEAKYITDCFFYNKITDLNIGQINDLMEGAPSYEINNSRIKEEISFQQLCTETGIFSSNGEVRRLVDQGGLHLNEKLVQDPKKIIVDENTLQNQIILLRQGNKKYFLIKIIQ